MVLQFFPGEHGKPLKNEFMFVVIDGCGMFDQEIGWGRNSDSIMEEFVVIIAVYVQRLQFLFSHIHPVADTSFLSFRRAPANGTIIEFIWRILPQFRMKPVDLFSSEFEPLKRLDFEPMCTVPFLLRIRRIMTSTLGGQYFQLWWIWFWIFCFGFV